MPNNRRGFGGLEYIFGEVDDVYWESIKVNNWPTSPDLVPVGGVWRDGNLLKVVYQSATELLPNGGFEEGTDEWTIPGSGATGVIDDNPGFFVEGAQSLYCEFADHTAGITQNLILSPDARYVVSGWIQSAINACCVRMSRTDTGVIVGIGASDANNEWQKFEFDFTADQ